MAKEQRLSALDRAIEQAMGKERTVGRDDDPAAKKYPELWQWMARLYVGGDHLMSPAELRVRLGPDGVLATLTNRDLCVSVDAGSSHLEAIFEAVEQALQRGVGSLRSWGKKEPLLRKRRKQS